MVATASLLDRMVEFLSQGPSPNEIVNIKATQEEESRMDYLSERHKDKRLSEEEEEELRNCMLAHHLMVKAKGHALAALRERNGKV